MAYSDAEKTELQESYEALMPRLAEAERQLLDLIQQAIGRIEDKKLVRAKIRDKRVKSLDSIRRKAEVQGLKPKDACLAISDLVGARVVCNTTEDVYRFRELLREELPLDELVDEQDYVGKPKGSGYRGLHLNFRVEVGGPLGGTRIPCEVQIRTLLQDSWAELVHSDVYKETATLPEDLRGRTQDLASVLAAADQIASRVRARVMQEAKVEPESVQLNILTKEGLAYIFGEVFGRWPPEYAVQRTYEACQDVGVKAVADLRSKLANKSFRDALAQAYQDELRFGPSISSEDIFALTPVAVAKGDKRALKEARNLARREREEIDAVWRREVLSDLPDSFERFVEELEAGHIEVEAVAEALGVAGKCFTCSETIIDEDAFLEAVAAHYDVEVDYELTGVLHGVADCWTNPEYPDLCSYHAYQVSKDD